MQFSVENKKATKKVSDLLKKGDYQLSSYYAPGTLLRLGTLFPRSDPFPFGAQKFMEITVLRPAGPPEAHEAFSNIHQGMFYQVFWGFDIVYMVHRIQKCQTGAGCEMDLT